MFLENPVDVWDQFSQQTSTKSEEKCGVWIGNDAKQFIMIVELPRSANPSRTAPLRYFGVGAAPSGAQNLWRVTGRSTTVGCGAWRYDFRVRQKISYLGRPGPKG